MKGNVIIYYDDEADFLEINIGKYRKGYFEDIGEGIAKRVDEKTGKTTGVAILSFRKRIESIKTFEVALPVKIEILG